MSIYGKSGGNLSPGDIAKMRPNEMFIQMNEIIFYVLSCHGRGKGTRCWTTMYVRELFNEEISTILIGWNTTDAVPEYTITYLTKTNRPGAQKDEKVSMYTSKIKNPSFNILDIDLRMCLYRGDYLCIDLKNGEKYSFAHSTSKIRNELSKIQVGDIVSVCRHQNKDYFIASYAKGIPTVKKYDTPERIILKKETGYKWTIAQLGRHYRVCSFMDYNQRAEHEYPRANRNFNINICEEAEIAYGYAKGFIYGGEQVVIFTNIRNYKMYTVPLDSLRRDSFEELCEDFYIVKAHIVKSNACQAYIAKFYMTEVLESLEYVYDDDGKAYCMDMDTYEMYEIPFRYMPNGIKANDILYGSTAQNDELKAVDPTGRIFVLSKR